VELSFPTVSSFSSVFSVYQGEERGRKKKGKKKGEQYNFNGKIFSLMSRNGSEPFLPWRFIEGGKKKKEKKGGASL